METQNEQVTELIDTFEMLDDWEERYGYLIDLGRQLPPMADSEKSEENRIKGCQSQVWVVGERRQENGQSVLALRADSDSSIVKGLVAILYRVYSGQPSESILTFDINGLLDKLQLGEHLSMNRRNGLMGMIQRIKQMASTLSA